MKWLSNIKGIKYCTIRFFSKFVGKITAICPAVKYGWVHVKYFEHAKYLVLLKSQGSYKKMMPIPEYIITDIKWWEKAICFSNNSLDQAKNYQIEIFSDASLQGWGAFCVGQWVE